VGATAIEQDAVLCGGGDPYTHGRTRTLTYDEQVAKLERIVETAEEVWG
jgi:hypothetical protein